MKRNNMAKGFLAGALALFLLLAGVKIARALEPKEETPSDTLNGIFEALIAPDSDYSQNKAMMLGYYPELEYSETLDIDRITLELRANGNEYYTDGSWEFVQDGDRLTVTFSNDDYMGAMNAIYMAEAVGTCFGMETELISGYLNGLGILGIKSENFTINDDESTGTTTCSLNIAGAWDMKELDQMVLNEAVLDAGTLQDDYTSQSGSLGKIRYLANGNVNFYTVLLAEYGELDDLAYQSIVNLVTLREPAGYEAFLADFTELKDLETDDYTLTLNPDGESVTEIMGERNGKFSYALLRFGSEEYGEEEYVVSVPDANAFEDFYFRVVAEIPRGTAGASLSAAQAACDVLSFAADNELWLADTDTLRMNMLDAWMSLTDDERTNFDVNFRDLNELLNSCFEDWDANRGRFDDAGVAEPMEELIADGTSQWSWDTLSAHTWTLGNSE